MECLTIDNSTRNRLIQLNNVLSKLDITNRSPQVVGMFDELFAFCSSNVICSSKLNRMLELDPELRATCENLCRLFALHGFYAEIQSARVCASDKKQNINEHFKHRQSYEQLIQCEMNMLQDLGVHLAKSSTSNDETGLLVTKIAFIGSGPIPTSSMIILNDHGPFVDIYNIDMCQEANQLASIITKQVLPSHLSKRMHFITQNICESPLPEKVKSILNQCQLIYLAAYVGINESEKLDILQNLVNQSNDELKKKIEQHFVIRTAEGLYQVLFPKVRAEKIAMLQVNTSDINDDILNRRFLFQIRTVHQSLSSYGIITIIATNKWNEISINNY